MIRGIILANNDLYAPENIPRLLKRYGIRPAKGLGQNFLIDKNVLARVAGAAEIRPEDVVLEIGAGLGNLTRLLGEKAQRVVAVELDRKMIPILEDAFGAYGNIEIVQGDILEINLENLFTQSGYVVAANIPYYITSAILRHLLGAKYKPARVVLTVQDEVAKRIIAKPGKMSLLALSVQVFGEPKIVGKIPAGAFYPAPKVDSAIVRVDIFTEPVIPQDNLDAFFELAKAGFSQKRKTLRNSLSSGMGWEKSLTEERLQQAGIDPQRRAQTLSLEEWGRLVEVGGG